MKYLLIALSLLLVGCGASNFTANTTASVNPANGFAYSSNKNQENLKATGEMSKDGTIKFSVETNASTPEAAIAAALQSNLELQKQVGALLQVILPMAKVAQEGEQDIKSFFDNYFESKGLKF